MEKRIFSVLLIGFCPHEQRVLNSTFSLSNHRNRSYRTVDGLARVPAEIIVVDADAPEAVAEWRAYKTHNPTVPTVLVTNRSFNDSRFYIIYRPIVASRLLRTLDQVTINELKFAPELIVKDSDTSQDPPINDLIGAPQRSSSSEPEKRHYRALVVDDSLAVRKLMQLELNLSHLQTDFAESVAQASELLTNNTYDIVFLDVVLPDGDGYQLSKLIKHDKLKKRTPVIMLTGKSSPFDKVRGKLAGCDAYIPKPAKHDTLQKVINQYLKPLIPL
jgi:twitching motility two-component system response regulator PilG